ncbi:FecR family protein [Spirosoma validum]|uniref:FecR domain-containing protein n=1 Tax=Spirosoma validum TaxID=2771355 RepID=A0A927GDS7_9BACT|nr:FecR domain-containing protein [Spirosoma validum]MBD2753865.1 FecR domain-containing protein [Spirosoma validum]
MADQQPIDDALLGKFLAGETDPAESARVRQWLVSQKENPTEPSHEDFAKFERIWEAAGQPTKASANRPKPVVNRTPAVDTDAAWRTVQQKMRTASTGPYEQKESASRSLSNRHSGQQPDWYQTIYRIAAVLVLVTSFGWLVYQFLFMGQDHPAQKLVTLVTNNQKLRKTLPDGTTILLNRHSVLTYPTAFAEDRRDVTLTGEAFFDVTPDAKHPFRIQARRSVVQVLGTSFSVQAYTANVSVAVRTGKVRLSAGRKAVLLTKNQQATFEAKADTIRRMPQMSPNVFAYQTEQLVFNKEPLRDVIQAINQYYNADVRLANEKIGNCRLTTRFDKTPLETVLAVMSESLDLRVRHEGRQVILEGNGCQ